MSENAEIIIDVDVDTEKVDKRIEKLLNKISSKKIELDLNLRDQANIKKQLAELQTLMNKLKTPSPEMHEQFDKLSVSLKNTVSNVFILREQLKSLSSEYKNLLKGQFEFQATESLFNSFKNISNSIKNIGNILFLDMFKPLGESIAQMLTRFSTVFITGFSTVFKELYNRFLTDLVEPLKHIAYRLAEPLVESIAPIFTGFSNVFKELYNGFLTYFAEPLDRIAYRLVEPFAASFKQIGNKASDTFKSIVGKVSDAVGPIFSKFNVIVGPIKAVSYELKSIFQETANIAKVLSSSVSSAFGRITSSFKSFNLNTLRSSKYVDYFGRRIFNLLRNAFVFNIISRQFRGLSTLLGNLVNRDIYFAKSLMIVKANLVRAFAPIWQIILPWIRALGEGLVWISNQLIKFVNYLTGSKIKPLEGFQEAKQVVDDFKRISSPTKDLFDLKDPNKYAKELRDNLKKSQLDSIKVSKNASKLAKNLLNSRKQTTKLLAKFDKLEVLKFEKIKDPLGLNELSDTKNLENNKDIDINVDVPSIEEQIADAINNIEAKPLDFYVNDDIGEQITSQVNGLTLPPLNFKVSEESQESVDNFKKKLISLWETIEPLTIAIAKFFTELVKSFGRLFNDEETNKNLKDIVKHTADFLNNLSENKDTMDKFRNFIIGIGAALVAVNIAKKILDIVETCKKLFSILAAAFDFSNPAGWITLAVTALVLIVSHWDKVKGAVETVWDKMKDFGNWIKDKFSGLWDWLKEKFIDPIANAFGKIGSWFRSKFGWHSGSYIERDIYNVPRLAQGSVLKGGDPFLAYLNDQPRGQTNIEAPLSTIVDAFKQALSESDYNRQPDININASGDMSGFIRMLNFKLQDNNKILGNAFIDDIDF